MLLRLALATFIIGFIATAARAPIGPLRGCYDESVGRHVECKNLKLPLPPVPLPPKYYGKWKDLNQSEAAAQRRWLKMNRTPTERLQDEIDDLEDRIEALENK